MIVNHPGCLQIMNGLILKNKKLPPVLREACEADEEIIESCLSAESFGDITAKDAIALAAIAMGGESGGDFLQIMGIPQHEASHLRKALTQKGYLPDTHGSQPFVTARGNSAISAVKTGVQVARYVQFGPREGDIIISTMPKSGTTWMQMICALLVFQTPDLPAPLHELSPTLDSIYDPFDTLRAQLAEQRHRRFIKTHLPLHLLKIDPKITYIVVARHPLDAAISYYHQSENLSSEARSLRGEGRGQQDADPSSVSHKWLLEWIEEESITNIERMSAAWPRRDEPNIVFTHYADLSAELDEEMRRLASRLGIAVPEEVWPSLVEAATFKQMKANAEQIQPVAMRRLASQLGVAIPDDAPKAQRTKANTVLKESLQRTNDAFFRQGTSGSGQELLTSAELADYYRRAARVAPPELLTWLHRPHGPEDAT